MSTHTVYSNLSKINWNAKGTERILQNVNNLLNTYAHEVAYNRKMGRSSENIDKPVEIFIAAVIEETFDLVPLYEPRALVKDVEYMGIEESGIPILKVVIEVE